MSRSRRRIKKNSTSKHRVGVRKTKKCIKAKTPQELTAGRPDIEKKLGTTVSWTPENSCVDNYKAAGFLFDANQGFGRNQKASGLVDAEQRGAAGEPTFDDDDELRAGCNLERHTGKAAPQRLAPRQIKVIQSLVEAHGEDLKGMVRDTKRNKWLHSEATLRRMIASLEHWGTSAGVDFRCPNRNLMPKVR